MNIDKVDISESERSRHRYCVILCGGVGSRFWPFSRSEMPKQFLDFLGTGSSLLQMTVERVRPLVEPDHIFLLTNEAYAPLIREQLPDIPADNILLEPARRNTAPCICWASHHIHALDPDASVMTFPSDHLILKQHAFEQIMTAGLEFVESHDALLTLGIIPTGPETGYGYIQKGAPVADAPGIMKVKTFTEKPDAAMAKVLLQSGEFLWNAGIFVWRTSAIIEAFRKLSPDIESVFAAGEQYFGTPDEASFIAADFASAPSISVDYAIMEKASNVYVLPADLGWSDLGTWKALYEISPRNMAGNVTQRCNVLDTGCKNTVFAVRGDKIVVASGLDDYIVADSDNALLIWPLNEEQRIRSVVNEVKNRFGDKYV